MTELAQVLDPDDFALVMAHLARMPHRPMYPEMAAELAKGGIPAEDIISHGLPASYDAWMWMRTRTTPGEAAALVASLCAVGGWTGGHIRLAAWVVEHVTKVVR